MARLLALCSLPRMNPGDRLQFRRVNGPYKLIMTATSDAKLPYGILPRLLLAWVCSEAVRTQRRELVLGRSLYEFMHKLGMESHSGGARGDRTRLRNQMDRLFGCSVTLIHKNASGFTRVSSFVADKHEFWWDVSRPDAPVLWDSKMSSPTASRPGASSASESASTRPCGHTRRSAGERQPRPTAAPGLWI